MLAVKLWTEPSSHKMVPPPRNEYGEKKPQTAKGDEVRRCRARLRRGLRTSAKPTNNNLVTRGPTRLPTLPRPQRCGLTRVCSAAAEADVIVVIQVTLKRTKHVAKSAAGKYVAFSPCHASGSSSGKQNCHQSHSQCFRDQLFNLAF